MSALKLMLLLLLFAASVHARRGSESSETHPRANARNRGRPHSDSSRATNNVFTLPMTLAGDKYYYLLLEGKTWQQGKDFCASKDLRLVTFETQAEIDYVSSWLMRHWKLPGSTEFWTAGTDIQNHGIWMWDTTGEAVTVNAWAPGEPDNDGRCMTANNHNGYFKLNDLNCDKGRYILCESTILFPGSTN